jgi:hypothetical protein
MDYRPNSGPGATVFQVEMLERSLAERYKAFGSVGWTEISCIQYIRGSATVIWQRLAAPPPQC